jgi:hypothetical protein
MQKPATRAGFLSVAGGAEAPALNFAGGGLVRVLEVQPQCVGVEGVDLRLQALEVTGHDIVTRDKVALRLNLSATWRFTEVLEAQGNWPSPRNICTASCSSACAPRWARPAPRTPAPSSAPQWHAGAPCGQPRAAGR